MKTRRKQISLIISIILVLISFSAFFFLYREIKNNIKATEQLEINLQEESLKRNEIKTLNNYLRLIEKEKILLETHFIKSSDVVPFLNTLEKLASGVETKTEVSSINIEKDNSGLVVEMKNIGSFSQIYKFITLLENAPYELKFVSIDIHKFIGEDDSENNYTNKWEALIKLKLLSFN